MKIKMLTSVAGEGFVWNPGDEPDVKSDEARRLIKAGFAAAIPGKGKAEVNAGEEKATSAE